MAMDGGSCGRLNWLLLAYIYCIYLMREADFHNAFSIESLSKFSSYSMAEIPFGVRLAAAIILLFMVGVMIYFLVRYMRTIVNSILSGESWAIAFLLWFILLFSSQVFDRAIATSGAHWKFSAIEELLEVSAALFAVLAITQFAISQRRRQKT